jgi:hypothetical protein
MNFRGEFDRKQCDFPKEFIEAELRLGLKMTGNWIEIWWN